MAQCHLSGDTDDNINPGIFYFSNLYWSGTQPSDKSATNAKDPGLLAFLLGIILLAAFFLSSPTTTTTYFFVIRLAILCLPGLMLFIIGFQILFGRALPVFERVFPMTLMIFGVYLMLSGILLFIVNLWSMAALSNPAATVVTLICALIVLIGQRVYAKGKVEAGRFRRKHEKRLAQVHQGQ